MQMQRKDEQVQWESIDFQDIMQLIVLSEFLYILNETRWLDRTSKYKRAFDWLTNTKVLQLISHLGNFLVFIPC